MKKERMNKLIVKNLTYHLQDLVEQKKIKTFTKFKSKVFEHFDMANVNRISHKFIYKELKNIYTFLKQIQHHPNNHLLAQALRPLLEMLLNNLVIPEIVYAGNRKFMTIYRIKYTDLVLAARRRNITQTSNDFFDIAYRGSVSLEHRCHRLTADLRRCDWVSEYIYDVVEGKVDLSLKKHGISPFFTAGWSTEQLQDFGERMVKDYYNSETQYLPLEFFKKGIPDAPDPEGH